MSASKSVFNDDFKRGIVALAEEERGRVQLFVESVSVNGGENAFKTVCFEKNKRGRVQIKFFCNLVGKVKIKLSMDEVVFLERYVAFDGFKTLTTDGSLFVNAGRHTLSYRVESVSGMAEVSDASFVLTGGGLIDVFRPQVYYECDGENYYLTEKKSDGFYFFKNTVDDSDGVKITFADGENPQKIKLKYFGENRYVLFKTEDGIWKVAPFDIDTAVVGIGVELVKAWDCDVSFSGEDSGEVYFVVVGELYRAAIDDIFTFKRQSMPTRVVLGENRQRTQGVYVCPHETNQNKNYLVVWGASEAITAITTRTLNGYVYEIVATVNEPNCVCAFAVDGVFSLGTIKNGLFSGREVRLVDGGVDVTVTKKRYCCGNVAASYGVDKFVVYDDGKYILI